LECASPQDHGVLGFLCNGFVHLYPQKNPNEIYITQGENFKTIGLKTYGWGFRKKVETLKLGCEEIPLGPTKFQFFCNESVSI
jgi:hypothetical protein